MLDTIELPADPTELATPAGRFVLVDTKLDMLGVDTAGSDTAGSDTVELDTAGSDMLEVDTVGRTMAGSETVELDIVGSDMLEVDTVGSETAGSDTDGSDMLEVVTATIVSLGKLGVAVRVLTMPDNSEDTPCTPETTGSALVVGIKFDVEGTSRLIDGEVGAVNGRSIDVGRETVEVCAVPALPPPMDRPMPTVEPTPTLAPTPPTLIASVAETPMLPD